jgi:hypothetical protein
MGPLPAEHAFPRALPGASRLSFSKRGKSRGQHDQFGFQPGRMGLKQTRIAVPNGTLLQWLFPQEKQLQGALSEGTGILILL